MKKNKIMATVMALTMLTSTNVFANEKELIEVNGKSVNMHMLSEANTEDSIEIMPSKERINADGSFTFDVGYSVLSNEFKIKEGATSIRITTSAIIENSNGSNVTGSYEDHSYQIILYANGYEVGEKSFTANGDTEMATYAGLDSRKTYTIKIINNDYLPAGTTVVGSGTISNYVHIN